MLVVDKKGLLQSYLNKLKDKTVIMTIIVVSLLINRGNGHLDTEYVTRAMIWLSK